MDIVWLSREFRERRYFLVAFKKDWVGKEINIDKCDGWETVGRNKLFGWFSKEIDCIWTALSEHKGSWDRWADEILRWVETGEFQWESLLWRPMFEDDKSDDWKGNTVQRRLGLNILGGQKVRRNPGQTFRVDAKIDPSGRKRVRSDEINCLQIEMKDRH